MAGIPSDLFRKLRQALLECGPFESDGSLTAVFAAPELRPWRYSVRQATSRADRVDALMAFLVNKSRADTGCNALVLLLRVLSSRLDPVDRCHGRLERLAGELERALGDHPLGDTGTMPRIDQQSIKAIERAVREDDLERALEILGTCEAHASLQDEVTLLTARLTRLRGQARRGTLTHPEVDVRRTGIARSILDLIGDRR